MKEGPNIATLAALIGDPARANMLTALMTGKALTATELAQEAGITAQTASTHISKLETGGLITRQRQGRHSYISLASADVAGVLEGLMGLAAGQGQTRTRTGPKDAALRHARVCYNHLAGERGVQMFDSLQARQLIKVAGPEVTLTDQGAAYINDFGIDLSALSSSKTPLCRSCLDWSARRSHLAGSLGRAMLTRMIDQAWVTRTTGDRTIRFTDRGNTAFTAAFPPTQSA